jgi:hypothetical protein
MNDVYEVLSAVTNFLGVTPCSPTEFHIYSGGTCYLLTDYGTYAEQYVSPKCRSPTEQHSIISRKLSV